MYTHVSDEFLHIFVNIAVLISLKAPQDVFNSLRLHYSTCPFLGDNDVEAVSGKLLDQECMDIGRGIDVIVERNVG